ncbi:ferritin family protein [Ruminococcus sp. FC2018]|jgi:rubrerythrin|uniref:rubrerythrin family protein n=1 Tax=Ruminococcus sp. FC2018 TaxID=1410617 RepID=UPI00048FE2FE|nr:ferritin family protein [Ruminococcus sp. FC2018]
MDLKDSQTRVNLMRAYAGESQARNRYSFAQKKLIEQKQFVAADLFRWTADQEKEHARIFYEHLQKGGVEETEIQAAFPVDKDSCDMVCLFQSAAEHEFKENEQIYPEFARIAREEGFSQIAQDFENIASIEKSHGERFRRFAQLQSEDRLYSSDESVIWVCTNCGYILEGTQVPQNCPVCHGEQGYYIRLDMADWGLYK